MKYISYIEKQVLYRLFGISDGYIFTYWASRGMHNKTKTKELILESCGINIYEDERYKRLSQQKCFEKIWEEECPQTVSKLLSTLCDYFCFLMGSDYWTDEDCSDYQQVKMIIDRIEKEYDVKLPDNSFVDSLTLILDDIESNLQRGKPEMVLDRLHTFATEYFRDICRRHNISIADDKGEKYPLHSLVGMLKKWYENNHFFESDFCATAIGSSISIFEKFNAVRNEKSAAHPNTILNKIEAEYVVKIIADTLMFVDKIENAKKPTNDTLSLDYLDEDKLPFD